MKLIDQLMSKGSKYPVVERAVRWIIIMLLAEFALGTALTTVIGYDPDKHGAIQGGFLIAHIVVGVMLILGSFAHTLTSRSAHILGPKPLIGFVCILAAFSAGIGATKDGSDAAVLVMALFFGAAIVTYGLSYVAVKAASQQERR